MRSLIALLAAVGAWFANAVRTATGWITRSMHAQFVRMERAYEALTQWVLATYRGFSRHTAANALGVGILGVLLAIVGGIVVFIVLGEMVTPFFDALGSFLSALTLVEIGDTTAANVTEVIISSLAILVGVGGALFIVGYGLRAAGLGRKA